MIINYTILIIDTFYIINSPCESFSLLLHFHLSLYILSEKSSLSHTEITMTIQQRIAHLSKILQKKILADKILCTQIIEDQRDDEEIREYLEFHNGKEKTISTRKDLKSIQQWLLKAYDNTKAYHKKQSITIRLNTYDIIQLKKRAFQLNIPYQTLIGSALHEFATKS